MTIATLVHKRQVREVILRDRPVVIWTVVTVPTARGSNVRTMHARPVGHHVLMHHSAQQCISPQLIRLSQSRLLRQKGHATLRAVVLGIRAVAVGHRGVADADCQFLGNACGEFGFSDLEGGGSGREEVGEEPVEVSEDGVVHGHLALGIEDVPGVNDDGDGELEGGEGKVEAVGGLMSVDVSSRRAQGEDRKGRGVPSRC